MKRRVYWNRSVWSLNLQQNFVLFCRRSQQKFLGENIIANDIPLEYAPVQSHDFLSSEEKIWRV